MPLIGRIVLALLGVQFALLIVVFAVCLNSDKGTLGVALLFALAPTYLNIIIVGRVFIDALLEKPPAVSAPVRITVAIAFAALCYVVCSHFSNNSVGISTGLSAGETKAMTAIVFFVVYAGLSNLSKKKATLTAPEKELGSKSQE